MPDTYRGIRVTLQGTASPLPKGASRRAGWLLHAPDGRGLLVTQPATHTLPAWGSTVQVTGTLVFDDLDIPSLKMGKADSFTTLTGVVGTVAPRPHVPVDDWSNEDRWSLMYDENGKPAIVDSGKEVGRFLPV